MDPHFSNRRLNSGADDMYARHEDPDELNSPGQQNRQSAQNQRQPQYTGAYTLIPPNESRRSKTQRMAQKEEEDWQKWKEENRPGPISLPPAQLGGGISLAEARERQAVLLRPSKLQKKMKQEEMDRKKREEEEEKNRQMKAVQREKAYKLEEKRKQEELLRRCQFREDRQAKTERLLQSVEESSSAPPAARGSSLPASSWDRGRQYREAQRWEENMQLTKMKEEQSRKSELREEKQKEQEEERRRQTEMDHRRVNAAFLDKIEGRTSSARGPEPTYTLPEDGSVRPANEPQDRVQSAREPQDSVKLANEPRVPVASPGLEAASIQDDDDHDQSWVVMKLMSNFPLYEREFLEDIVEQCNGDYQQAYSLLQ